MTAIDTPPPPAPAPRYVPGLSADSSASSPSGKNSVLVILAIIAGLIVTVLAVGVFGVLALRGGSVVASSTTQPVAVESVSVPVAEPATSAAVISQADQAWLRVDGLGAFSFGDSAETVIATVGDRFGTPSSQDVRGDCPAGIATLIQYNGLTLHMTDNQLAGWVYTGSTPALTTPSGITSGTTLDQLQTSYPGVDVFESSLGTEFYYEVPSGYIAGFVEGQIVTSLYSGETCFFR